MTKELKVTSLEEIREQATPIVELPGWNPDQPFYARVRRVSMLDFIAGGQIPNDLLGIASKFLKIEKGYDPVSDAEQDEKNSTIRFAELFLLVARAVLVEPTFEEVEAAGGLTDDQVQAIFLYATRGPRALEIFRSKPGDHQEAGVHSQGLEQGTE